MPKKDSPVDKFPGHVVLPEYFTLPQVRSFENALDGYSGLLDSTEKDTVFVSVIAEKRLPAIFACVEEWHIDGVPEDPDIDTFPMTPIGAANELVSWLFGEIQSIWMGEVADPKD